MSVIVNQVRRGYFLDSVALMRISRRVASLEGVEEAALMMGSPANQAILESAGLLAEAGRSAGPGDLILATRAGDRAHAEAALTEAGEMLENRRPSGGSGEAGGWRPRTLRAAVDLLSGVNLALISVPGDFAAAEARRALAAGLHSMIFSDNVALEEEVALKRAARERGLLVMGPDCGTAIIGGTPLAFANAVPAGDIAIIGASGTGIQEVSSLIARAGGGVSQAIGVGGRDLSTEVGGITTLMAIEALESDPATRRVVLISKPPAAEVVSRILDRVARGAKQYTICFLGAGEMAFPANARGVATLRDAALDVLEEADMGAGLTPLPAPRAVSGRALGLFCGGTLAAEAQLVFQAVGLSVASNAPVPGANDSAAGGGGHKMLDLGADEFTRGRPHPMIDPEIREDLLVRALGDPAVGVVLLDLVIGQGAHDQPAAHVVRAMARRGAADRPLVVASVTGTDGDRQSWSTQVAALRSAGVLVAASNADAAAFAAACVGSGG